MTWTCVGEDGAALYVAALTCALLAAGGLLWAWWRMRNERDVVRAAGKGVVRLLCGVCRFSFGTIVVDPGADATLTIEPGLHVCEKR